MKVLVIGSGGREHALLWKLAHSPSVKEVYVIPGNDGMTDVAHLIPVKGTEDILDFARLMEVDLTVAGPETVLTEGLADKFAEKGMAFFGPSAAAAQIEGSKSFAKNLMKKYKIPTAAYETFTDEEKAVSYIKKRKKYPLVIKADGLASGKGVVIAETEEQAVQAVRGMLEGKTFGSAGESVVIEEFMEGEEASVLCFTDGNTIVPMISAQDHKRISDGDRGANTGGMGAYAPAPVMTKELDKIVYDTILLPAVKAMKKEGCPFKGCLYAGLMITKDGLKVVEFNCRFGDPETEAVLPLLESDLAKIMLACTKGTLKKEKVESLTAKTEVTIDYKITCNQKNLLSFQIMTNYQLNTSMQEYQTFNLDLSSGRDITLQDLFGKDYEDIINTSVRRQIKERTEQNENASYFDGAMGFQGIRKNQPYYIDSKGNVVIIFEKYSIAPGYMGTQEFKIPCSELHKYTGGK